MAVARARLARATTQRKVLLVDDQPAFLDLARGLLQECPGLVVVGQATGGEQALTCAQALRPDVAVVDVLMPGISGFKLAQRLREQMPQLKVIVVSAVDDPLYPRLARAAGAVGFLSKKALSADAVVALLEQQA
jgi:DNA-binding NarL/FixJ family response regulator